MAATPGADRASAQRIARMLRGLEWLMIPVLIALGFLIASFPVRNSDFWMHLATGRLIAQGNYSFGVDPFSHASGGLYWVNNSWLYDFALYQLYNLTPTHSAAVYVKAGLVALIALIMFLAGRPGADKRIVPGTKADPSGWAAAILVGIALLAMLPHLFLQPVIISYLFAAMTFLVLQMSRRWPAWGLPVSLAVLFALWSNLDAWFILGPVLVALFLIGEVLQIAVPGSQPTPSSRIKNLAITLAIGLAACLINPHHYHVFTVLPAELEPNIVKEMQVEFGLRQMFLSPTDVIYLDSSMLGKSIAGYSYGALIVLSLISFGLTTFRPRLSLLLVWVALLGLSLFNWRLIPFFAVVAAPIAALNVQTFFARRPPRDFEQAPAEESKQEIAAPSPVEQVPVPSSTAVTAEPPAESWWPGAKESAPPERSASSNWAADSSVPTPAGSGMNVTPENLLVFGSILGRLFTLALGLLLLAAAYPGWLHATDVSNPFAYHVSWDIALNPNYQQAAEQLAQWRKEGKIPADAKGLPLQPSLCNYLAWFAPEEKGFIDYRFALLGGVSGDYMKVKRGLHDLFQQVEKPTDYAEVLKRRGITHVIISDTNPEEFDRFFQIMFTNDREWALWFQNGKTAIFGWHGIDPKRIKPPEDPLRIDLESMAFGANVQRIPAPETFGVSRDLPPDPSLERTFLDRYLTQPAPPSAPESDTAFSYIVLQPAVMSRVNFEAGDAFARATVAASLGLLIGHSGLPPMIGPTETFTLPFPNNLILRAVIPMGQRHPLSAACGLLAIRNGQIGVLSRPNSGRAHLILALAYSQFPQVGSINRPRQLLTAGHQALARLTLEQRESPELGRLVTTVLIAMFREHLQRNEHDLALECLDQAIEQYERFPPIFTTPEQQAQDMPRLAKAQERLQKEINDNREKYDLELATAQRGNVPPQNQVQLARNFGLVREAMKLLQNIMEEGKLDIPTLHQLIAVYLSLGQPEDAQRRLDEVPEQFRGQFEAYQTEVWIALGDYDRAGAMMEHQIGALEKREDKKAKFSSYAVGLLRLHFSSAEMAAQISRLATTRLGLETLFTVAFQYNQFDQQRANLYASRAMLALEQGDLQAAATYFQSALAVQVRFIGDVNCAVYRRALEKQGIRPK